MRSLQRLPRSFPLQCEKSRSVRSFTRAGGPVAIQLNRFSRQRLLGTMAFMGAMILGPPFLSLTQLKKFSREGDIQED